MASYKCCICFTRKFRSRDIQLPPDVRAAHHSIISSDDGLRRFLSQVQGESSPAEIDRIVASVTTTAGGGAGFARLLTSRSSPAPSLDDLFRFLFNPDLNPPITNKVHQDMTLTARIEMIRCLKSIKEYAFYASPYPLVITLEDHLTRDLQAKVAQMLTKTFGDLLFIPDSNPPKVFPSPKSLMKKIIISTKPPEEYKESLKAKDDQGSNFADEGSLTRVDSNSDESDGKDELDEQDDEDSKEEDPKYQPETAYEYRKLITIQAGKPKGHLRDALKVDPDKVRRLSLSETQLSKATSSHGADIIRFTEKNILRVYPKGTRLNSSNYNPMKAWTHGAQMVAFNMQGHGKSLRLMQGFFRANGGCGYVKKPDFLLRTGPNGKIFDPQASLPVKRTLKVKVYMGDGWRMDFPKTHFDTYSPPDFYTRGGIAGVRADTVMQQTRMIQNQWVPVWDEEFTFPLTVPELALLRVEVKEYDMAGKPDFGGQTCLPVWELKQGIRAVALHDRKGNRYKNVRLLMRFNFV